jgi:hypothetical protein
MDRLDVTASGFCVRIAMAVIDSFGAWVGPTRMSTPLVLGTTITLVRDRARLVGLRSYGTQR